MAAVTHSTAKHDSAVLDADAIIRLLDLQPHPEGGFFRETFRDPRTVAPASDGSAREPRPRAASTAIYFLLKSGEVSHWHAVDAAEVWHHYAGAPLALDIAEPGQPASRLIVGPNLAAGQRPQAIVPAGHWQWAESLGGWSLAGCTVAPGFEFDGFVLASQDFQPE
jgi:uncharacterized protein